MGYRRKLKTITLQFEGDDELNGLEVTCRSLPLGTYLELMGMGEVDRSSIGEALQEFSKALVSWNLEDEDGSPVPATREAVLAEDHDMMLQVASRWLDYLTGVVKGDSPLDESSPSGGPSPEASIPMAPLSESRAS